MLIWTVTFS